MLVLGTTRVGKTRLGEILITQDIHRGDVVIVLDPKGDPDLLKRCYCEAKRAGRLNAFYALHLGFPEWSARYNAIGSFERETEVASRVARQLPSVGNSAAFREFSWRFVNIVARALIAMGQRPDYRLLLQHVTHIEPLFVEYCRHWLPARSTALGGGSRGGRTDAERSERRAFIPWPRQARGRVSKVP